MNSIKLTVCALALAGLAGCSSMGAGADTSTRTAASETSPGTGSVAPAVTGKNSSTVTPPAGTQPAPQDTPR